MVRSRTFARLQMWYITDRGIWCVFSSFDGTDITRSISNVRIMEKY